MRSAPRALPVSIILLRRLAKYHCDIRFVRHQGHPKHRAFFAFLQRRHQIIRLLYLESW